LNAPPHPSSPVPVIDLDRLSRSDSADETAVKFRSALQSWGLFLVSFGFNFASPEEEDETKKIYGRKKRKERELALQF
jgi:hypothetical protein